MPSNPQCEYQYFFPTTTTTSNARLMLSSSVPHSKGLKRKAKNLKRLHLRELRLEICLIWKKFGDPSFSTFGINISYYQQWLTADKRTLGTLVLVTVLGCDSLLAARLLTLMMATGSQAFAVPLLTNWSQFR